MKATITQTSHRFHERYINRGFNVFTNSNASDLADSWFSEKEIYSLDFKCKAWSKLKRAVTRLEIKTMRKLFGDDCKILYSLYTGCSMCPCSPGYRVRKCEGEHNRDHFNHDVWVNIEVDTSPLEALLPVCEKMLKEEIIAYKEILV